MLIAISILIGIVLALVVVAVAHRRGVAGAHGIYAVGLFVAAVVYFAFALMGRAESSWIALEGLGVALFGAVAWLGLRRCSALLGIGWLAHVFWDVALHLEGTGADFTPAWYPWLCVGFDLVIAGAVLMLRQARR